MSGKPSRNKETHYHKTDRPADTTGGQEQQGGRKRKPLSPERVKDQAKRSRDESGRPAVRRERPAADRRGSRPEGRNEAPFRKQRGEEEGRTFRAQDDRPFDPAGPRPDFKSRGDQKPYNRNGGSRPFKKYVPFDERTDKSTHLDGNGPVPERKPLPDRRRANNETNKKRPNGPGQEKKAARPAQYTRKHFEQEDLYEDERPFTRSAKWNEQAKTGPMTLNKYLAHSGMSSRREAAEIVKSGKVKVNGEPVLEPGYRVKEGDQVTYDGKEMKPQEKLVYILLNKPKDYITTTDDEKGRKKVMDLVAAAGAERLYPVGRLDRQTTGVLLITNDGDLAQKLSHPSYNSKKIYQVTLDRNLTKADFDKIIAGIKLEDGVAPVDALAFLDKKNEIGIEIHTGRNRIVRRIFEALGYTVEKLDRVVYAGLTKKNVSRGKWRFLTEKEVIRLKHFNS